MSYVPLLEKIGLTKGESAVYLTLLKLGQTTTGKIVDEAGISSGKIYEILEKLIRKGLVSYILKEKTKYFEAAPSQRILDYMHEEEQKLKQQENDIQKILPQLEAVRTSKHAQYEAVIYKGFRGMQTAAYEALNALNKDDEVLAMGIISRKEKAYNLLWQQWHRDRMAKKIGCKAIFTDERHEYYTSFKKMKFTTVKKVEGVTPAAVDVMANKTMIFTYKEPSCLLVTSEEIAQSFRELFYTLWKIAK